MARAVTAAWRESISLATLLRNSAPLNESFFGRESSVVARELIGCLLVAGPCAGRIVETEAYLGERDAASHAFRGPTLRNQVMFGPPGFTYVYFIYGMYHCLNFVTESDGVAGAVLIRAIEPLAGIDVMRTRRPKARCWQHLASGPGKLTQALRVTREHGGLPPGNGEIEVRHPRNGNPPNIAVSPRIGIRQAADSPLRFFEQGNPCVSPSPWNKKAGK